MPKRSNNTSIGVTLLLFTASLVGLGVLMAWLVRQISQQATEGVLQATERASNRAKDAYEAATKAARDAILTYQGGMPVGTADVGDVADTEQQWEGQIPWYLQGNGYDPTDDRLPDPQSTASADRTVLIAPGIDLLEMVKNQPTPDGFAMPLPDLSGEDFDATS